MLLDQLLNVRLVTGQLRNNCNYFHLPTDDEHRGSAVGYGQIRNKCNYFYLSTDDEHRVWEGDQPLVMDNSETNVIIFHSNMTSFFRSDLSIGYNLISTCAGACD